METADKISNIVIGKTYLVAHVNVKNPNNEPPLDVDVPIIPIWHNDKIDFGFDHNHYHLDGRFIANRGFIAKTWNIEDGLTSVVVSDKMGNIVSDIFYKKKKCLRLDTGVPAIRIYKPEFIKKYSGKSCKGRKCPHWGTLMNEVDGELICPMHRLKGNLQTEIII